MKVSVSAKSAKAVQPTRTRAAVTSRSMSISIGGATRKRAPAKKRALPLGDERVLIPYVVAMLALFFAILSVRPLPIGVEDQTRSIALTVSSGMSATQVSALLHERGVVDSAEGLLAYIVESGLATSLQQGPFVFDPMMSYAEVAAILTTRANASQLTIGAGFTIERIDTLISQRFGDDSGSFIEAVEALVRTYHLGFGEGWLLSGVYEVSGPQGAQRLAQAMYEAMLVEVQKNLSSPLLARYSVEELLIIASLIQAETQNKAEMAGISAVIHNRLAIDEPLGIDASTRYELNDWHSPIPIAALERLSPYNTRRRRGLPPTGICAPSKEAVQAAFFPEDRDDLFYLHGLDQQIHWALTYDEHQQNIRRYR